MIKYFMRILFLVVDTDRDVNIMFKNIKTYHL